MSRHKGYREGDGEQYDCGSITPPLVMVMHETDRGVYRGSIFNEELIHYRKLDETLKLPPGTSKKHLKEVAKRYGLEPYQELENTMRFVLEE